MFIIYCFRFFTLLQVYCQK